MFIVTAVETVGDISGCIEGGMGREATDKELSGGVMCDGAGSSFAALFGVLPNTSFSQNVGLVTMTKIVNRTALGFGAIFLIVCGLCPKLAALVSIMPQSVLGGAAIIMFSSIVLSGIQLITKDPMSAGSGLWPGRKQRCAGRSAELHLADFRRLRHCSGSTGCDYPEHCSAERKGSGRGKVNRVG